MSISVSNLSFSINPDGHNNIRTRTQSSLHTKRNNSEKIKRPKSSPIKFNPDGLDSFYLTQRTQTAPAYTQNVSGCCKRYEKVDSESVVQYRFPSAVEKRVIPSSQGTGKAVEERKMYNLGPGYVIYRNDSEFTIRIDSDDFFGPRKKEEREAATKKYVQDHKDILISELQEQISSLTVALEEEKMNHNLSVSNCNKELELTRATLTNNYEQRLTTLKEDHSKYIDNLNEEHRCEIENQKEALNQQINRGLLELNTYKASFESFRQSLIKEAEEKFKKYKDSLADEFHENLKMKLDKQKSFLTANFEVDIERIRQENLSEIEKINSKHKSEIEILNRRFTDVVLLEDKLSHTLQELTKKKKDLEKSQIEYDKLYEMYSVVRKEMTIARNDNDNLKSELQEFSDRFEERVRRVDDDYKERLDSLHNQIVEIRRAYMAKCEELVQERKNADTQLHGRIENAKDVMKEIIHTRQRARISLVSLDTDTEVEDFAVDRRKSDDLIRSNDAQSFQSAKSHLAISSATDMVTYRPSSAPTTDKDERLAKQNIFLINKD